MAFHNEPATLRYIVFEVVASTPDGKPVYSVADIVEPLIKYYGQQLRRARKLAGPRGYVLVGRVPTDGTLWPQWEANARRIDGTY